MTEIDDSKAFGDFLSRARHVLGKSANQLEKEFDLKNTRGWHEYHYLPSLEKLPLIAKAYGVDLAELTAVYDKCHARRKAERESRHTPSRRRRTNLNEADSFDLPSSGPVSGRTHSYRNSGGR